MPLTSTYISPHASPLLCSPCSAHCDIFSGSYFNTSSLVKKMQKKVCFFWAAPAASALLLWQALLNPSTQRPLTSHFFPFLLSFLWFLLPFDSLSSSKVIIYCVLLCFCLHPGGRGVHLGPSCTRFRQSSSLCSMSAKGRGQQEYREVVPLFFLLLLA